MKVLHLCFSDQEGGAARCAYRIHEALREHITSVESQMLVIKKHTEDESVFTIESWKGQNIRSVRGFLDRKCARMFGSHDGYPVHSLNILKSGILREIKKLKPDVIHLHWISGAMISIYEIASLRIPVVWTLHDLWPLLGVRHHPEKIVPSEIIADNGEYLSTPNRLSKWLYHAKAEAWHDSKMTFVSQCEWSRKIAERSLIGKGHEHSVIGCPLDTSVFCPDGRKLARQSLGLNEDEKVILIGSSGALSINNKAKGFHYLFEAMELLPSLLTSERVKVITVGNDQHVPKFLFPTTNLGHISDNRRLAEIYSAADLVVVPSVMETFGQSISEPMACGTPVVAFDATSQKDLIEDGINGYLAAFPDTVDLAMKIGRGLLESHKLRGRCRAYAAERWDFQVVAKKYESVYQRALA